MSLGSFPVSPGWTGRKVAASPLPPRVLKPWVSAKIQLPGAHFQSVPGVPVAMGSPLGDTAVYLVVKLDPIPYD